MISPININSTGMQRLNFQIPTIIPKDPSTTPEKTGKKHDFVPLGQAEQLVAELIDKEFNIKIKNTRDKRFNKTELIIIYQQLKKLPKEDVALIEEIVKNDTLGMELEMMEAKMNKNKEVFGAYDKENRRIYLFKDMDESTLRKTLTHEIGHAVHSHRVSLYDFLRFTLAMNWKIYRQEQSYIQGNLLYNIGTILKEVQFSSLDELVNHFDFNTIKKKSSKVGGYILKAPKEVEETYAYSNPFETFASYYEKKFA